MTRIAVRTLASTLLACASAHAAPPAVPVSVVNTSAQAVPTTIVNTPTVNVANLPGGGTLYWEVLGVSINVPGGVAGTPGTVVPPGKRRIINTISARVVCPAGKSALLQVFGHVGIFLPTQFAYNDHMGRTAYAIVTSPNFVMPSGFQLTPIIESDGSDCQADIFLSGVEVPDQP